HPVASWQPDPVCSTQACGDEFADLLDKHCTPLRYVTLRPFLLQVKAKPLDPATEAVAWGSRRGGATVQSFSPTDIAAQLSHDGFRLPTSDEWEYACAAGTRTVFRWGDECPLDADPLDVTGWDLHRRPNAFGLHMPSNPYHWEFCAEPTLMRGG